jgi:hypothetical protein
LLAIAQRYQDGGNNLQSPPYLEEFFKFASFSVQKLQVAEGEGLIWEGSGESFNLGEISSCTS